MSEVYENPKYYDIAFSFRDIPAEVDLFEECFKRFSGISVKSILELGCGNSPHMEELTRRGYRYNGLDLCKAMLAYSREKASRIGVGVNLIHGDMLDFSLRAPVDFVFVTLDSLFAGNITDLISHFGSVAQALKPGGLYLLDWCVKFDPPAFSGEDNSWEMERDGVRVKTTVSWKVINRVEQTFEETISLEVDDRGKELRIAGTDLRRAIYPQEFLLLVSGLEHFEFVGWWNNWNLEQPLERADKIDRPVALIRRV